MSITEVVVLFVGDDRAEDHHDVEVQDEAGKMLKRQSYCAQAGAEIRAERRRGDQATR
ncbi:hypothetical protein [Nonomuraea sp. NPDC005692]|uniref:hypothetical protein n=1 Tax=Nonomuraea sp. NPDC005692 TaxID=3157168 RepID=UPI00340B9901